MDFHSLSGADRSHKRAVHAQTGAGGDELQQVSVELVHIDHHLHIMNSRTIINSHEVDLFTTAAGTYPAFHIDLRTHVGTLQQVDNFCSTNCFHKSIVNEELRMKNEESYC